MNELIKIENKTFNNKTIQAVRARELYEHLKLDKSHWSRWYKKNIVENPFAEEFIDWERFAIMANGNETLDFIISLDLAKKLAMQARTPEGEEVRNYFLECEKKAFHNYTLKDELLLSVIRASSDIDRALAINSYEREYVIPLENKVEEQCVVIETMEPKVEFYDMVVESSSTFSMQEVAKVLNFEGVGRNKLFAFLREKKILDKNNIPYQQYVEQGLFRLIETTWTHPSSGDVMVNTKTVVYQKGLDYISKILLKEGYKQFGIDNE